MTALCGTAPAARHAHMSGCAAGLRRSQLGAGAGHAAGSLPLRRVPRPARPAWRAKPVQAVAVPLGGGLTGNGDRYYRGKQAAKRNFAAKVASLLTGLAKAALAAGAVAAAAWTCSTYPAVSALVAFQLFSAVGTAAALVAKLVLSVVGLMYAGVITFGVANRLPLPWFVLFSPPSMLVLAYLTVKETWRGLRQDIIADVKQAMEEADE
ncbi:unnamed protein product [Pedinophyceae sp. YPF-701]|nr:unnamed protein product [Pedinophyceae sp. YPF-701]